MFGNRSSFAQREAQNFVRDRTLGEGKLLVFWSHYRKRQAEESEDLATARRRGGKDQLHEN
jgi:hypothetical protein